MQRYIRLLIVSRSVLQSLLALAMLNACAGTIDIPQARNLPPAALARDMGLGVNIGNTMDSIWDGSGVAGETGWGNPPITREFIGALANHGYKTIRLPVTWAEHIGAAPNYTIETAWMNRVEEVVDWCLAQGLYVIVNLHHDGGDSQESWIKKAATNEAEITNKFKKVWEQIADKFAFKSDYLIFEAMNEVGFDNLPLDAAQKLLTSLNQAFVNTVRASDGLNPKRFLLVAGYWTDIDRTCDTLFQLPVDKEKRLMLSIHYYTPSDFCIAEKPNNDWGFRADWGGAEDEAQLKAQFGKLKARFLDAGVPVVLGEYGVVKNSDKVEAGRVRWMTAVTQICLENGVCPVLWDTGGEISRKPPFAMSESLIAVMKAAL